MYLNLNLSTAVFNRCVQRTMWTQRIMCSYIQLQLRNRITINFIVSPVFVVILSVRSVSLTVKLFYRGNLSAIEIFVWLNKKITFAWGESPVRKSISPFIIHDDGVSDGWTRAVKTITFFCWNRICFTNQWKCTRKHRRK